LFVYVTTPFTRGLTVPQDTALHVGKGVFLGSQLLALFAVRHENVATVFGERV